MESDKTELTEQLLDEASRAGCELQLTVDPVAADNFDKNATPVAVDGRDIPDGLMGLDIGPRSRRAYQDAIAGSRPPVGDCLLYTIPGPPSSAPPFFPSSVYKNIRKAINPASADLLVRTHTTT